ncbi:Rid family hydrolase [Nocardioides sp. TF02-7]|uniref:RidA family protein n=1 Tax=Nocardioides sp. TF02-7 TaxID=2917724 RepID=UPI001F057D6C|nr:Rid family hydrolase [Nocardioides sp. TF02-7]UMG93694.1 RidA family protein [Nocardioides sp. TF02-7]
MTWRLTDDRGPAADAAGRVRVTLADGSVVEGAVARSGGGPDHPLTRDEVVEKAVDNGGDGAADVVALVERLDDLDSVEPPARRHAPPLTPVREEGPPMTLQAIRPETFPWFPYDGFTFCLGLSEGDSAWTSGHTAGTYDESVGKMTVGGSMEQQARTAYAKVLAILAAAGFGPEDVTRVTENVTLSGLPHYEEAVAVRTELFGDHQPTVRTVVVERLVRRAAFLEVELHAVRGGGKQLVVSSGDRPAGGWQAAPVTEGARRHRLPPDVRAGRRGRRGGPPRRPGRAVRLVPRPGGRDARRGRAHPRPRRDDLRLRHPRQHRRRPGGRRGGAP